MEDYKQEMTDHLNYRHMLYKLHEFMGDDVVLETGPVKRLFYDPRYDDVVFEFYSGKSDYILDRDLEYCIGFMRSFVHEYPEEYKKFMETYEKPVDEGIFITKELLDSLEKNEN